MAMMASKICPKRGESCLKHKDMHCDSALVHVQEVDNDHFNADKSKSRELDVSDSFNDSDDVVGNRVHEFEKNIRNMFQNIMTDGNYEGQKL